MKKVLNLILTIKKGAPLYQILVKRAIIFPLPRVKAPYK
jgi:hypothetical protein